MSTPTTRTRKRNSARCTEAFADCLLASSAACALIDRTGVIRKASRALEATIPDVVGKVAGEVFNIDVQNLLSRKGEQMHGVYADAADELVPVILQALYDIADTTLVLAVDGAPFRDAEARRFDAAPFTVLRAGPDGAIRFASRNARDMLHQSPKRLHGTALASLFTARDAVRIEAALRTCAGNKPAEPAVLKLRGQRRGPPLRVSMMPDLAPDKRPLGVVAVIQSTRIEHARDEIKKIALNATITDWRERLRRILKIVKPLIGFEHALFGVYAEDTTLYRAAFLEPEEDYKWPCRWMWLPAETKQWLKRGKTWFEKIEQDMDEDFGSLKDSEVTLLYKERGIVSSVTLPAIGANGASSALTLCSKHEARYGERDLMLMRELGLEPVMLRLEAEIQREREIFLQDLRQEVTGVRTLTQAGQSIVEKIGKHFRWDHVSLFRVNRSKRSFELVYQHAPRRAHRLRKGYAQEIKTGMLAATLKQGKTLVVDDYLKRNQALHDFRPINRKFRSAMTSPVRLNGRIRWIVDAESTEADAFRGPDKAALQSIVDAIEQGLAQRVLSETKSKLLNQNEQGVVLVGMEGAILEMNAKAAMLLGTEAGPVERGQRTLYLARYGADKMSRDILRGRLPTTGRRIELRGANGKKAVIASRSELAESYDMALWFFSDLESNDWTYELRYLRETVTDVAQQTRAPLTLASALAQRMPELCAHEGAAAGARSDRILQVCDRVVAEVRKADITFERLADRLEFLKAPRRTIEAVNLGGCIEEVRDAFPERDRKQIDLRLPRQETIAVAGDRGRIASVFRSIFAHLLRCRPDDETRVGLELGRLDGHAVLKVGLTPRGVTCEAPPFAQDDALWQTFRAAREDAGLGLTAIETIIEAHGGTMKKHAPCTPITDPAPPWVAFDLELPLQAEVAS